MATTKSTATEVIEIRPIEWEEIKVRLVGDTPLIMHAWSEKAKRQMLEAQQRTTKTKARELRDPVSDFINSMYWLSEKPEDETEKGFVDAIEKGARFCFPVTAIKQAGNSAAYRMGWVKNQMGLRGSYFLVGNENQMVEVHSDVPIMREDMVTVGIGGTDLRYRGEFRNWYINLTIRFNKNGLYSKEQILNVINAGGSICGIGEWRPEKDGQYGMYHIEAI